MSIMSVSGNLFSLFDTLLILISDTVSMPLNNNVQGILWHTLGKKDKQDNLVSYIHGAYQKRF